MIAWFARNPVAANLLLFTIVIAGLLAMKTELTLEVFPSAEPDSISINVALRGATPEDAELGLATRIEEAVQDLEGIDIITSTSIEGSTSVILELASGYDPREVLDDVKSRVDAINTFPGDAEKPLISLATRIHPVINVVVAGQYSETEILQYAEMVREELLNLDGITQVALQSVRNYEIAVEVSQDRLRQWQLSLSDITQAIRDSSVDISAGNLKTVAGEVLIRSKGQAYRRDEFEAIVVKTNADGSIVKLGDVARVDDGFEEEAISAHFNGKRAALVAVSRVGDQSALAIADQVKNYITHKQASLPAGMALDYWNDMSQILKDRLGILQKNAIQGTVLVLLLLTLFLRPSIAFWVFIGIPVSFIGAFITMGMFDISLNIMSAFGFIVVLGIVVDDAIVTGENVYRHLRSSESSLEAAIRGTEEVAVPVTFGVLTTIMAFLPIAFLEGRMGAVFGNIPAVVIPVLIFSLIESKFVLPAHLGQIRLRNGDQKGLAGRFASWQKRFADGFEQAILRYYKPVLRIVTEYRYATLATTVGLLILIVSMLISGWARFVFFPTIESDSGTATLTMPVGTPFEVTDRYMGKIADAAFSLQEKYRDEVTGESVIIDVLAVTGSQRGGRGASSNTGYVTMEAIPPERRIGGVRMATLVDEWRQLVGDIPGAESLTYRSELFRTGSPIDIQLRGNSFDTLAAVGEKVKAHLAKFSGVYEIADSLSDGKEELRIELTPQGHLLGLTRSDVVTQVGEAFKGAEAQRIQRGRDDIRVLVRYSRQERGSLDTLHQMLITAPNGVEVPLSNVVRLIPDKGPSQIRRIDGYRVLDVTAEVDKESVNMTALRNEITTYLDDLLHQYPGIRYTMEGEAKEQRKSFSSLQSGLVIVLFGIYCLLALPLRSYLQPLVVMSVIPFGIIGAVIGHWIMGFNLSMGSLAGMLALLGVMVNDSLVLVNYINRQQTKGYSLSDAILEAGVARFRPVILTSLTTFFGLLPLLLEKSISAQFLIPMGISLGFGIIFATLLTLLMVPANVLIAEDAKRLAARIFSFP
jgi:multidrug efflux pump subunit AcrB